MNKKTKAKPYSIVNACKPYPTLEEVLMAFAGKRCKVYKKEVKDYDCGYNNLTVTGSIAYKHLYEFLCGLSHLTGVELPLDDIEDKIDEIIIYGNT